MKETKAGVILVLDETVPITPIHLFMSQLPKLSWAIIARHLQGMKTESFMALHTQRAKQGHRRGPFHSLHFLTTALPSKEIIVIYSI